MLSKVNFNNLEAISQCANNPENSKFQKKFYGVFSKFNTFQSQISWPWSNQLVINDVKNALITEKFLKIKKKFQEIF